MWRETHLRWRKLDNGTMQVLRGSLLRVGLVEVLLPIVRWACTGPCCSNSPHYLYQGWRVSLGWCGGPEDHDHDEQGPFQQAQAVRQGVEAHLPWRSEAQQGNLRIQAVDGGLQVVLVHVRLETLMTFLQSKLRDRLPRRTRAPWCAWWSSRLPSASWAHRILHHDWHCHEVSPCLQNIITEHKNLLADTTSPTSAKSARLLPTSCSTTSRRGSASAAWAFLNISSQCQRYQTKYYEDIYDAIADSGGEQKGDHLRQPRRLHLIPAPQLQKGGGWQGYWT